MTRHCHTYLLLTALFILAGCAREAEDLFPEPEPALRYPISWEVYPHSSEITKALIDNTLLQQSCTPVADNSHQSIGVWGQYTVLSNGQNTTFQEFIATPLTYGSQEVDSNIHTTWNYQGEGRYWESQAIYDFRACYPQKLMTSIMTQMDATIMQGGPFNTSVLQEDILVAATQVNTRTANLYGPVVLNMQHVFAAIKFNVRAVNGFIPASGEGITSCWLQNRNNATDLFSPSGYLVHSGNIAPEIIWYPYESSVAPMYTWKHKGVSFNTENTLYTANGGLEGEAYTHNDGWLLVIPQSVKAGTLSFCYTLKNAGSQVFSVNIPAITYEPGKKYTYVLEIRGSEADVVLTITPWNHLESSHDITI